MADLDLEVKPQLPPRPRSKSVQQWTTLAILLLISWSTMCTTHEFGHLVGGWLSGAKLQSWSLAPWSLPYSLHNPDPYPLVTLWGGPFLGVLMPIAAALLLKRDWAWFVAHFCVLANGIYLAIAWFTMDQYLDTRRLLDAGSPRWSLFAYCLITISIGYIQFRKSCIKVLD